MEVLVQHTQLVRQMYDAFRKNDISFILKHLDKDAVLEVMGDKPLTYSGIYHGPDDAKRFFEKLNELIEPKEMIVEKVFENGNLVVAIGNQKGVVRKNKKPVSSLWCHIYEFNSNGKVVHYRSCFDTLAVAKAIGL